MSAQYMCYECCTIGRNFLAAIMQRYDGYAAHADARV
jgi:hypothetical protein